MNNEVEEKSTQGTLAAEQIVGTSSTAEAAAESSEAEGDKTPPLDKLNALFAELMQRYPSKGLGTSSMGKFDPIRRWLAEELGLDEWTRQTYAVGSSTAAHNFNSRWVQNNLISGNRVPFGAAFLSVPADSKENNLLTSAMNANEHFVDGSRPTSFEAIITFIQRPGQSSVIPYHIQALADSNIADKLVKLFPGTPVSTVTWRGSGSPNNTNKSKQKPKLESAPLSPDMLAKLREAFDEANYQASDDLAGRVISSLAAKPFLLLAGLSGTGKTLLALALSRWLAASPEQLQVIAVGADWTNTHHLIGYPDALDPSRYVSTPVVELLLHAKEHPELPYFLILDEMNLSHVERYFSDFLSAMESHEDLILHPGPDARENIPPCVPFPANLFVIGTINIDETTYVFSPKVIDRANVVEFQVTSAAMEAYLSGQADFSPAAIQGLGANFGIALADAAGGSAGLADLDDRIAENFRAGLLVLFEVLDRAGLQFGFRTVREIIRFLVVHNQLYGSNWDPLTAFDAQLAQRLLPRMNGDQAKLRPPLITLLAFCSSWKPTEELSPSTRNDVEKLFSKFSALSLEALQSECGHLDQAYPLTSYKIFRMLKRLSEYGFATAIEA